MIIIWYLIASIIVSIIFGLHMLTLKLLKNYKHKENLSKYIFQIWFLVAFFILCFFTPVKVSFLNFKGIITYRNILILSLTIISTSLIVSIEKCEKHKLLEWILLGITMEIPQRLFMQTFFMIVLRNLKLEHADLISIFLNTILWVQFILIQDLLSGNKINHTVLSKIFSSVCFSVGMGFLYVWSDCIVLTMIGHGAERALSEKLRDLCKHTI